MNSGGPRSSAFIDGRAGGNEDWHAPADAANQSPFPCLSTEWHPDWWWSGLTSGPGVSALADTLLGVLMARSLFLLTKKKRATKA